MRLSLTIFGHEVLAIEIGASELEVDEPEPTGIGGASTHNFERDTNPLSPDDRWDWEWEDKRKGFGFQ